MAMPVQHNKLLEAVKVISEQGFEGMGNAMQLLMNEAMNIERSRYLQADPYERTSERTDYANGFKSKTVKTTIGSLALRVPQTRNGEFYPSFLEKGQRSERALKIAMAEMYVQGVSTRNVTAILEEMCGCDVSSTDVSRAVALLDPELLKWRERPLGAYGYLYIDARYEKVREGGCVIDCAVLVAYGVNEQGHREILGTSVSLSEAEVHWRRFLEALVARGLHGINLIVSDAHAGLKAALKAVFPSVPWQRCQFHLQQNAQAYVTKMSRKREVADSIRAIFNAENAAEAERLLKQTATKYEKDMPQLAAWMLDNIPQGLSVFQFPAEHRRRIRTSNIAERVNQEIRRRTRVARIFPNTASCERLVSAILMETSEQWVSGKIYLAR
jgi:transposase-like protein